MAWRKIIGVGQQGFRGYIPRVNLREIEFNGYLELSEQEPSLRNTLQIVVDIFGIEQPEKAVQVLSSDAANSGKPLETPLNRSLRKFFEKVPADIRRVTAKFGELSQWDIMSALLKIDDGLIDLQDNPALLFLHARRNRIFSGHIDLATVRRLIRKPRAQQVAYYRMGTHAVRILRKVCPEALDSPDFPILLHKIRLGDREFIKKLAHLSSSINILTLKVLANEELYSRSSLNFLEDLSSADDDYQELFLSMLNDFLSKGDYGNLRLRSTDQLFDAYFAWHEEIRRKTYLSMILPPPPFWGDGLISPLEDPKSIVTWGAAQRNCIGRSWVPRVANGRAYLYRYEVPTENGTTETGTLALLKQRGRWRLADDIKTAANRDACPAAYAAARAWFATRSREARNRS